MGTIRIATPIRAPAERCFDLARSVSAHLSSMRTTHERVVTSIASDLLGPGAIVTWEATHLGARIRLMSKITQYDAPRSFEAEQIAGPFQSFWHRHEFSPKQWRDRDDRARSLSRSVQSRRKARGACLP